MLTQNEQKILLEMLVASITQKEQKIFKSSHFYKVMSKLKKKGYVRTIQRFESDRKRKAYELTEDGKFIASWIAKEFDSEEKYKDHAYRISYVVE